MFKQHLNLQRHFSPCPPKAVVNLLFLFFPNNCSSSHQSIKLLMFIDDITLSALDLWWKCVCLVIEILHIFVFFGNSFTNSLAPIEMCEISNINEFFQCDTVRVC